MGVMTAAVPQAKTSAIEPSARPACSSVSRIVRSLTSCPASVSSWRIDERVTPSRMEPVSAGVDTRPSAMTTNTFMPPSSSTQVFVAASRKQTCSHPRSCASCCGNRLAA